MTSMRLVKAGEAVNVPAATRAYRTGRRDGDRAATARAADALDLFQREVSAVVGVLGDALIANDEAAAIVWYGVLTRVLSAPAD